MAENFFAAEQAKAAGTKVVLDIYPLRRLPADPRKWLARPARRVLLEKLPFLLLAVGSGVLALGLQMRLKTYLTAEELGLGARLAIASFGVVFYLWKTIVPTVLLPLYPLRVPVSLLDPRFALSGVGVIAITAGAVALRKRFPAGLAVWASYLILLGPVSGLIHIGPQIAADRYTYLPTMGFAALAGGALLGGRALLRRSGVSPGARTAAVLIPGVIVVVLGVLTWTQTHIWRNDFVLWQHTLEHEPDSFIAHLSLGGAYYLRGLRSDAKEDLLSAVNHLRRATELRREDAAAHSHLGQAYLALGRVDAALAELRRALAGPAKAPEDAYHLARALEMKAALLRATGEAKAADAALDDAQDSYQAAIDGRPDYVEAHVKLGAVCASRGDFARAFELFSRAEALKADDPVLYFHLAEAHRLQGELERAVVALERAVRLRSGYAEAHARLGALYLDLGRGRDALAHLEQAQRLGFPVDPAKLAAARARAE